MTLCRGHICSLDKYAARRIGGWTNCIWAQIWHGLICSSVQPPIREGPICSSDGPICRLDCIWVHSSVDIYAVVRPPIHPAAYVSKLHMCPWQSQMYVPCNLFCFPLPRCTGGYHSSTHYNWDNNRCHTEAEEAPGRLQISQRKTWCSLTTNSRRAWFERFTFYI